MRIAIHDYAGHPFVFELSRELAHHGHTVRHFYFNDDPGPKGSSALTDDDADGFSAEAISISRPYTKTDLFRRRSLDIEYGKTAASRIAAFSPDIVISGNAPLESQALIQRSCANHGHPFIFWVQDLYSLAVRDILSRRLFGLGHIISVWYRFVERITLNRSNGIVLICESFREELTKLRVSNLDIAVIPNWGPLKAITPSSKMNAWSTSYNLTRKFVFLYSGTLGLKHDPSLLLALADEFNDDDEVMVVVAAVGAGADQLRASTAAHPRSNLLLKDLEPLEVLPLALASAEVMVALLDEKAGRYSAPSKVLSYLCAGRAVLLSAPEDNHSARIVADAGAGIVVPAGNPADFVAAARKLRLRNDLASQMGNAGRKYAEQNFEMSDIVAKFEELFANTLARSRATTQ